MQNLDQNRLMALEARLGLTLPDDFVSTLVHREPIDEGDVVIVTSDRIWYVRTTYFLYNARGEVEQLDKLFVQEGHVLPTQTLPFDSD